MADSVYRFRNLNEQDLIALEEGYFWQSTADKLDDKLELEVILCAKVPNKKTQRKRFACLISNKHLRTSLLQLAYIVDDGYPEHRFTNTHREIMKLNIRNIKKFSGIVCFTSSDTSAHMWNNYGAKYTGAVFEYDLDILFPENDMPQDLYFSKVKYKRLTKRHKLDTLRPYLVEGKRRELLEHSLLRNLLATKRLKFKPEAELRLCIIRSTEPQSDNWQKLKYQTSAIKKVTFGHLTSPNIIDSVKTFLGHDVEYWVTEPPKDVTQEKVNITRLE